MCTVHFSKKYQLCNQSVLLAAVAVCAVHLAVGRVKAMVITEQANCLHIIFISLLQLGNPSDFTVGQMCSCAPIWMLCEQLNVFRNVVIISPKSLISAQVHAYT